MKHFWLVALVALVSFPPAGLAGEKAVKAFADNLASKAVAILDNKELSDTGKQRQLEDLLADKVDIDWVGRFVLGKYWRSASEQQQQAYQKNYRDFILKNYTKRMGEYAGQDYTIKQIRAEGDPGEYMLTMELTGGDGPSVFIDYRVRKNGAEYQIFDIVVEGVSMITTQRSEFGSVVSRKGLDFLIDALGKKAAG